MRWQRAREAGIGVIRSSPVRLATARSNMPRVRATPWPDPRRLPSMTGRSPIAHRRPDRGLGQAPARPAVLDELEAEAALDAEVAVGHRRVERRADLHDRVVLDVELERAADAAVRADRLGHGLGALVPRAGRAHVVLGLEHQRAGRADADAVAAVDAGRVGQRDRLLGRDPGVEAAPGDGDRERVLGVLAAGLDALVAEDALRVVADVEVVVDLDRLVDGLRPLGVRAAGAWWWPGSWASRSPAAAGGAASAVTRRCPRRSARGSPGPPAPSTGRPTSRGTRGPSSGCGGRARCRSGRPSRPRPCASRPARARATR